MSEPASADDVALRVLSLRLLTENEDGSYRVSSGAFHRDETEPSVYLRDVLSSCGLVVGDLCEYFSRDDCGVGGALVRDLQGGGYGVLHDPVTPPGNPADPAHAVIVLPEAPSKSQHRKMLSDLARYFVVVWPE